MVVPKKLFSLPSSWQRGHSNGHAGGGHDRTDKQSAVESITAHGRKTVEQTVQQRSARHGHGHTHTGHQGGNGPCPQQLFQVGAKAGAEHQQHHADLGKNSNGVAWLHQTQHTGPDQQTGYDLSHHLGRMALAGQQTNNFAVNIMIARLRNTELIKPSFFPIFPL